MGLHQVVHQGAQVQALVHHVLDHVTKKVITVSGVGRTVEADLEAVREMTEIPEEIKTGIEITETKIEVEIIEIKTKKVTGKKMKIKRTTKLQKRRKKTYPNLLKRLNPKKQQKV